MVGHAFEDQRARALELEQYGAVLVDLQSLAMHYEESARSYI